MFASIGTSFLSLVHLLLTRFQKFACAGPRAEVVPPVMLLLLLLPPPSKLGLQSRSTASAVQPRHKETGEALGKNRPPHSSTLGFHACRGPLPGSS